MNLLPGTQYISATTSLSIGTAGKPIRVFSVELIPVSTGSTFYLRNGITSGSNIYIQLDPVTANKSVSKTYYGGVRFPAGCWATCNSASFTATVVYTEEF